MRRQDLAPRVMVAGTYCQRLWMPFCWFAGLDRKLGGVMRHDSATHVKGSTCEFVELSTGHLTFAQARTLMRVGWAFEFALEAIVLV